MSHLLQIILPLICELLCGTRGLSRLAAAADAITSSGFPLALAGPFWQMILFLFVCYSAGILLLLRWTDRTRSGWCFWDDVRCFLIRCISDEVCYECWLINERKEERKILKWLNCQNACFVCQWFICSFSKWKRVKLERQRSHQGAEHNLYLLRYTCLPKPVIRLLSQPSALTHIE